MLNYISLSFIKKKGFFNKPTLISSLFVVVIISNHDLPNQDLIFESREPV